MSRSWRSADWTLLYRVFAVKDGAAIAGMLGNFAAVGARGAEHPSHTQANSVPPLIHIESRVSRYSYGYRNPNGPIDQVTWFVSEVRHTMTSPPLPRSPPLPGVYMRGSSKEQPRANRSFFLASLGSECFHRPYGHVSAPKRRIYHHVYEQAVHHHLPHAAAHAFRLNRRRTR